MSGVWAWLAEPFAAGFMQRAAASTFAVGVAAPLAGVWATSRRLVYLTDAMTHAILSGVAAAALLGGSLLVGGLAAAVVMAVLVAVLVVRARLPEDSAIGVTGQGLFALGVIGVSVSSEPRALSHVLFGSPLTVTATDVAVQAGLALLVVGAVVTALPVLAATTFDPVHARSIGIRTGLVDTAVIAGLALVVVIGLTTVGVLMALTLCIAPAVAARLLAARLDRVLWASVALGVTAGQAGLLLSYHLGLPAGPVAAVVAVGQVVLAAVVGRLRGRPRPGRSAGPGGSARDVRPSTVPAPSPDPA